MTQARWLGLSVGLLFSFHTHGANAPCDGNVPIKGCIADIVMEGNFVVLKSSTPNCSVIEWSIDGRGRQTTVIDGVERLELLTTKPKDLSVKSCTQVKDLRVLSGGNNAEISASASRGSAVSSSVAAASDALRVAEQEFENAQRDLIRRRTLLENGFIDTRSVTEAEAKVRTALTARENAAAELQRAQANTNE
jgi:hypothetical protein